MSEHDEYRDPDDSGADYRPVFKPALIALIFSIPSLVSIAWSPAILLNLIAVVLAIYSIIRIGDQSEWIGLGMARFALLMALISGSFCLTYNLGRTWHLRRTALANSRVIAELFMNGQYADAFEYSIDPARRQPEGTNLRDYYQMPDSPSEAPPAGLGVMAWIAQPPLSVIEADGRNGALYFEGFGHYKITDFRSSSTTCIYRYEPASPNLPVTTFQMVFMRKNFGKRSKLGIAWRLYLLDVLSGPVQERKMIQVGPSSGNDESEDSDAN